MGRKPGTATICLVCGDKACGINFNVASCMSCKTFFRRNGLRQKEIVCQFGNICKVNRITRRYCAKCRLVKCFKVGMDKYMIQTDDEKREMREMIRLNRIKRLGVESKNSLDNETYDSIPYPNSQNVSQSEDSSSQQFLNPTLSYASLEPVSAQTMTSCSSSQILVSFSPDSTENIVTEYSCPKEQNYFQANHESLQTFELGTDFIKYCNDFQLQDNMSPIDLSDIEVIPLVNNYNETLPDQNQLSFVSTNSIEFFNNFGINNTTDPILDFEPEFSTIIPNYARPYIERIGFPVHELIQPEQNLLNELVSASTVLSNPYKRIEAFQFGTPYSYECTAYYFYRLIRMCKQMNGFNQLSRQDQGQVLKSSLIPMMCIRTVLFYNLYRKAWAFVNDRFKSSMMFQTEIMRPYCNKMSYERLEQFPLLFRGEWKEDEAIFGLLTAIVLFTPKDIYLEYDKVNTEQHRYIRLLHRYLQSKYSSKSEADDCFHQLMYNLRESELLSEDATYFMRCLKGKFNYSPFFAKLLDLKCLPTVPQTDIPQPDSFEKQVNFQECPDLLNTMAYWL